MSPETGKFYKNNFLLPAHTKAVFFNFFLYMTMAKFGELVINFFKDPNLYLSLKNSFLKEVFTWFKFNFT